MATPESQTRRQRVRAGVALAGAVWLLLSAAHVAGLFHLFDLRLLDLRFRLRGERPASDRIAIVAIDDATVEGYGTWPLPRSAYAYLLNALEAGNAAAIGLDLELPEDKAQSSKDDAWVAFETTRRDNVVHTVSFDADSSGLSAGVPWNTEARNAFRNQGVSADGVSVAEATGVRLPYPELAISARVLGHITVFTDPDGAYRRQPLLVRYDDRVFAAFALRLFGAAHGHPEPPSVRAAPGGVRVGWGRSEGWFAPLDAEGATGIDFAGDATSFRHSYSMLEVQQWYRAGNWKRLEEAFAGRSVLVGAVSRTGRVPGDFGATPFAALTSLMYLHASVLDDLYRGGFLRQVPTGPYLGGLGLLAALLGWLCSAISLPRAAIVTGAVFLAVAFADLLLLARWAVDAPPTVALALAPLVYGVVASARHALLERHDRRREADLRAGRTVQQEFLPEALIGKTLSHYRILERIGSGGMGIVYRARDNHLRRDVALKVLPGRSFADENTRHRFRREAQALSRLSHPHIAGVFEFDSEDGADFIVMEHVPGVSLSQRLRSGPLGMPEALRLASQLLDALAEAHGKKILHRDIKPGNVMVTPDGDAKLLDFGLAKFVRNAESSSTESESLTDTGLAVGTLHYMAPEALSGASPDVRGDVYGMGALMFEMVTGERPFVGETPQKLMYVILNQAPPDPCSLNTKVPAGLRDLILSALSKQPENRPPTMTAFRARLDPEALG